jgi:pimeloyl-ACP methyl ester carboxylesterase
MLVTVRGEGLTLVFCHGFTTTSEFWREQMDAFSATHRVVAVNLPGHGRSPHPEGRDYTIDAFVDDLDLVFHELQIDRAVLVGLSMGGTVAQQFALRFPQRLDALVLVGATPHGLGPDVDVDNVIGAIDEFGVEKASQNVIERSFAAAASPQLLAFAKQEVIQTPEFVARAAIASLNRADSRKTLGHIKLPTLVVCGAQDRITPPSQSQALAAGIKGSTLVFIDDAAHFPMLEQPEKFNSVLRNFVDRIAG